MTDIAVIAVISVVVLSLIAGGLLLLRSPDVRRGYLATIRAIRWWMWPVAVAHVLLILFSLNLLLTAVPVLQLGWWMLLGGSGNVALGQTGRDGSLWQFIAIAVPLAVLLQIPHLAYHEELIFRLGSELDSWWVRLRRQVVFGFAHSAFAGVPLAAGIVLIGSGLMYQAVYLSTVNRLLHSPDLVLVTTSPRRLNYPAPPEGPYDPSAWTAYHSDCERVRGENTRLREEWFEGMEKQRELRDDQLHEFRRAACVVAAALHSCSNFTITGAFLAWLIFEKLSTATL